MTAITKDDHVSHGHSTTKSKKKQQEEELPTVQEAFSYVFTSTNQYALFIVGTIAAFVNGLVVPAIVYVITRSLSDLASIAEVQTLQPIYNVAYRYIAVGLVSGICSWIQTIAFEKVSHVACINLKTSWFKAVLNQDSAFHQVYNAPGLATSIAAHGETYRGGVGKNFGEGLQYLTSTIGVLGFSLYSSWRVTLILVVVVAPIIFLGTSMVVGINKSRAASASSAYQQAAEVAYATISSIRTVLALNGATTQIKKYEAATDIAYKYSISTLVKEGAGTGLILGGMVLLPGLTVLFGGVYWLANMVEETGCDPSSSVVGQDGCGLNGYDLLGAILGVQAASLNFSHASTFFENLTETRRIVSLVFGSIQKRSTSDETIVFHHGNDETEKERQHTAAESYDSDDSDLSSASNRSDDLESTIESHFSVSEDLRTPPAFADLEQPSTDKRIKAILPKHEIQALSTIGEKPTNIDGTIKFQNVHFEYPTRPGVPVFDGMSFEISAGQTVAFVGPSGGGKSTIARLLERFYDPTKGNVSIDGISLKDINTSHLRQSIGYVEQEPKLFATTIRQNIQCDNANATMEEIEQAAKLANAHWFIMSFPDGYDTHVGDLGSQLSGGQKQRIAIARVLVGNPKLLILDEATSALDSESERIVQDALENVISQQKRTTIIIAHRLTTIRDADIIAVVEDGRIVEQGNHEELVTKENGKYKKLLERQMKKESKRVSRKQSNSFVVPTQQIQRERSIPRDPSESSLAQIEFKDVVFSYPTRPTRKVLNNFSLKIAKGEMVALVGTSGGGKSTTVSLLERFYDPNEGIVEYLGHDIKTLNLEWYRSQFGYVGQEPMLFNGSIAENIAYGSFNLDMDVIQSVAHKANAHEFIMSFPNGYNTQLDDPSKQLSGGQKQRIAIARALYKSPKILLLDEATSALDAESEAVIQAALDNLRKEASSSDLTIIVIAHRLSTIRGANRIVYIQDGEIKECGSHSELSSISNGFYARALQTQQRNKAYVARTTSLAQSKPSKAETQNQEDNANKDERKEGGDDDNTNQDGNETKFSLQRAWQLALPDIFYLIIGVIGSLAAGSGFPLWGVIQSEAIKVLYRRVPLCDDNDNDQDGNPTMTIPDGFDSCEELWEWHSHALRMQSYRVCVYSLLLFILVVGGFTVAVWGFGQARERMNKRVRDVAFTSLIRQEVAYFDFRSAGELASQLQQDATFLYVFSGEPLRMFSVTSASVFAGIVISFVIMWPLAFLVIACVPLLSFAHSQSTNSALGHDKQKGDDDDDDDDGTSADSILRDTLSHMSTINALTMEKSRLQQYQQALIQTNQQETQQQIHQLGRRIGFGRFCLQLIKSVLYLWGGYLIYAHSSLYTFQDFILAYLVSYNAFYGLGFAMQQMTNQATAKASVERMFQLMDRPSQIDSLSNKGKIL